MKGSFQHWLHPVAKLELKVAPGGRSHLLVGHTSKSGHAIVFF